MKQPRKLKIAILCGGQSAEHEVSIESAKNVIQALDKTRYSVFVIYITQSGAWILLDSPDIVLKNPPMHALSEFVSGKRLSLHLGNPRPFSVYLENIQRVVPIDAIFPILHGANGEDGKLQGLLEILNIPYVGSSTLGSAVCMDKEFTKHILQACDIPVAPWMIIRKDDPSEISYESVAEKLGPTLFVKPANTGSSVGVSKVKKSTQFLRALNLAWRYDDKIIIEQAITGREIECAVLGNEVATASLPGEIIPHHEFYSYEAKYLDPKGADIKIPADLPAQVVDQIQTYAKKAFHALGCAGMARVDFFLDKDNKVYVNEANTLPGFTQISMYPKMWIESGITYGQLIDQLIKLAQDRFSHQRVLVNQTHVAERMGL